MHDDLIVYTKPKSSVSENIRTIRTNLEFTGIKGNNNVLLVTSSISGEGKSFISANLAISFAQTGKKVLLIDCDLRKGRQHEMFNINDNCIGLSNLLIDEDMINEIKTDIGKYIIKTDINHLFLIPRGTIAPNPSELLNSNLANELFEILKGLFDIIILDCSPTIGLPDSLILAKKADKVMIVSAIDHTPVDMLTETKKALENVNASIAGVVVNKVKGSSNSYYSKYYE